MTRMTKEELQGLISGLVTEAVTAEVQGALEPFKQQTTDWMKQIQRSSSLTRPDAGPATKGIGAARLIRALGYAKGDPDRAKSFVDKVYDDELGDRISKALTAGDLTAGGFMVPPEFSSEIIELLRARSIIRAAGARTIPMMNGTITLPKQTGPAAYSYIGENMDIPVSEPTGGQIVMVAKKLVGMIPISNDLLAFSPGNAADEFVRDDIVAGIATREDQAFIRDNGLADTPKGLRFWAPAGNITASSGTAAANVETDFRVLINALEQADVRMISPVILMAPRSKNFLVTLRDGNGNLIWPEIRGANPTIYGLPVFVSTNIPVNLGGGTETEVYIVDMADAFIAESTNLEIAVDSSASYTDGGTLVSAFERDQTLMRAVTRHDFAMRHNESVAIINVITWGA